MQEDIRIADKINRQLMGFSKIISKGLTKPKQKFISQMLFGIQVARDIKLSEIARTLEEEIKLIKTENRLSRNINYEGLSEHINSILIKEGCKRIGGDTVIALDLTSIEKSYACKMEHLAGVWSGTKKEVVNGYWAVEAIGADVYDDKVVPLYAELYSQEAYEFESENSLLLSVIRRIYEATDEKGIFVIDRGGDRKELINPMLLEGKRFIIRINLKRQIFNRFGLRGKPGREWANTCVEYTHTYSVEIDNQGCKEKKEVMIGMRKAKLAGIKDEVMIVAVKGFGKDPLLLAASVNKNPVLILEMYLTRWKIEESFRFLKQEYHIQDIRVRQYHSLKNTFALLSAVFFFLSVYIGRKLKLDVLLKKIYEKAKRFFEIPSFNQYALADGIHRILFGTKWQNPWEKKILPQNSSQLLLSFMRI